MAAIGRVFLCREVAKPFIPYKKIAIASKKTIIKENASPAGQ